MSCSRKHELRRWCKGLGQEYRGPVFLKFLKAKREVTQSACEGPPGAAALRRQQRCRRSALTATARTHKSGEPRLPGGYGGLCGSPKRGVLLDCAWTRKPDCEEARLLAGLPDVLLPERSVKC